MKGLRSRIGRGRSGEITGTHRAAGLSFGLVASRFNHELADRLLDSAVRCLVAHGATRGNLTVVRVPGAFETPLAVQRLAETGDYDALIALGVVVQGETPHAQLITAEVTRALSELSRKFNVPVLDGVVAALNWEQAEARAAGVREKNRGWYVALAAIEMATLMKRL